MSLFPDPTVCPKCGGVHSDAPWRSDRKRCSCSYPPGFIKDTTKALPESEYSRYGDKKARTEQLPDTEGTCPKTGVKQPCGPSWTSDLDALEKSLHEHFDAAQQVGELSWSDDINYIKGVISNVIADHREKQNAALSRQLAERQWQPIESAPRDATHILCYCPDGFHRDLGGECVFELWWMEPLGWGNYRIKMMNPTHWMPWPQPPGPEGVGEDNKP